MSETDFKHPRYRLTRTLGQGGMGTVYDALDLDSGKPLALKLFNESSPADRRLFESEIKTLGSLQHENIVELLDAGVSNNRLYFTMEYLQGVPLAEFPAKPLPTREGIEWLLRVTAQVLSALEYIHDRGIIHGDLKPSNIMVLAPDETSAEGPSPGEDFKPGKHPVSKLLDFGLARADHFMDSYGDIEPLADFGIADLARLNPDFKAFIGTGKDGLNLQYVEKQGKENTHVAVAEGFHDHPF